MTDAENREKALCALERLKRVRGSCKKWHNAGYFDVPGATMRALAAEGLCQMRKLSGSAPTEYRP